MSDQQNQKILEAFKSYRNVVWNVSTDIQFWNAFLDYAIGERQKNEPESELVYSAVFSHYNHDLINGKGSLSYQPNAMLIANGDLAVRKEGFLNWVRILSILKVYNSMELFLLEAIRIRFFSSLNSAITGKDAVDKIIGEIMDFLKSNREPVDKKNNKHILRFMEIKSKEVAAFFNLAVRTDLNSNWRNFFEQLSVLRNLITHQGAILNTNALNTIKSTGRDIFLRYFELVKDDAGHEILTPIGGTRFSDYILHCNDFALNTVKFLLGERDMGFLELKGVSI
jgi:hypothetical protein